jgi:chromosome partitioning protein
MNATAQTIAFANHKGGTGKTSSCLGVAGFLAKSGSRVLVVDFDPQASATSGLGIDVKTLSCSVYDSMLGLCEGQNGVPLTQVVLETEIPGIHLVPSEPDLAAAEVFMQQDPERDAFLDAALEDVRPYYDFILIDLPPHSGLLSVNGLVATDRVVMALDPSIYSLEAAENLVNLIRDIRKNTGKAIEADIAVLIRYRKTSFFSMLDGKKSPGEEIKAELEKMGLTVFTVPESIEIYEAQKEGLPLSHFAPESRAGRVYEKIAEKIRREA